MKKFKSLGGAKHFAVAKKTTVYQNFTAKEKAGFAKVEKELLNARVYEPSDITKRDKIVGFKVSLSEYNELKERAAMEGRLLGNYIRNVLFKPV
jgi:hypothetical protein